MKALKIILFIIVGLVAVVFALAFTTGTEMKSDRSIVINAPKAVIFEQVRLLGNHRKWSPWEEKDPNIKTSITGTDGTVGAKYSWEGNDDVGKGEQTIAKIEDQKRVDVKLHFLEPFESEADGYITLEDDPGGVKVTWGFAGSMSRPWNVMALFMNMDKAVGEDFEKGLARLKELAEKEAASMPSGTYEIKEGTADARTYFGIRKKISFSEIKQMFGDNMSKIYADAGKSGARPAGPPVGLYWSWDEKGMKTDMAAAIPVAGGTGKVGSWQKFDVKGGKALTIDHYGSYEKLGDAHMQINKYIEEKKLKLIPPVVEEYVTDPMSEKDSTKWLTRISYFVE